MVPQTHPVHTHAGYFPTLPQTRGGAGWWAVGASKVHIGLLEGRAAVGDLKVGSPPGAVGVLQSSACKCHENARKTCQLALDKMSWACSWFPIDVRPEACFLNRSGKLETFGTDAFQHGCSVRFRPWLFGFEQIGRLDFFSRVLQLLWGGCHCWDSLGDFFFKYLTMGQNLKHHFLGMIKLDFFRNKLSGCSLEYQAFYPWPHWHL